MKACFRRIQDIEPLRTLNHRVTKSAENCIIQGPLKLCVPRVSVVKLLARRSMLHLFAHATVLVLLSRTA